MSRLLVAMVVLALLCSTPRIRAQNPTNPHEHGSSSVIDGAEHPELIPDSIAYRLFFVTVSLKPNPTQEDRNRQQAQLKAIGLQASDMQIFVGPMLPCRTGPLTCSPEFSPSKM